MQAVKGTIKDIYSTAERLDNPDEGGYQSQNGWIYTFDMTIQNSQGELTGEIGSKTEQYPLAKGQEITVEPRRTDHGTKFTKVNPQYSGGKSGGGQRGGRQQSGSGQQGGGQKKDVDWDKIAEGKVLCNMISAAITAGGIKCPDIRTAKYLTDVVMGKPQGGDPNPDYVGDDPAPVDDGSEIPF